MDDRTFLEKRRDRSIATILGYKEREVDRYIPDKVSTGLRKVILDEINDVMDVAIALLDENIEYNQIFIDMFGDLLEEKK